MLLRMGKILIATPMWGRFDLIKNFYNDFKNKELKIL